MEGKEIHLSHMENQIIPIKKITLFLSVMFLLVSVTSECYCTSLRCSDSATVFLMGWLGLVSGGVGLVWLANPMLLTSWLLMYKNSKYAVYVSFTTLLICLSFLFFDKGIEGYAEQRFYFRIIEYKAGYWLWTGSAFSLFAGSIIGRIAQSSEDQKYQFFKIR
jgi:hypothetical protein